MYVGEGGDSAPEESESKKYMNPDVRDLRRTYYCTGMLGICCVFPRQRNPSMEGFLAFEISFENDFFEEEIREYIGKMGRKEELRKIGKMRELAVMKLFEVFDDPDCAEEVEEEMYAWAEKDGRFDLTSYKRKFVLLVPNLKRNQLLRESVLEGDIPACALVRLPSKSMRTKEQATRISNLEKEAYINAAIAVVPMAESDEFKCGRCKKRRCVYFQKQTRAADEPSTTFVRCMECDKQWKFS